MALPNNRAARRQPAYTPTKISADLTDNTRKLSVTYSAVLFWWSWKMKGQA